MVFGLEEYVVKVTGDPRMLVVYGSFHRQDMHDWPDAGLFEVNLFHFDVVREQSNDVGMIFEEAGRRPRNDSAVNFTTRQKLTQ